MSVVRISPEGVGSGKEKWQGVYNPSFDVTPAELISKSSSDELGRPVLDDKMVMTEPS